jgi:hypothetical protein
MVFAGLFKKKDPKPNARITAVANTHNEYSEEAISAPSDARRADRDVTYRDSRVYFSTGGSEPCIINDVSATGMRISCQVARSLPEIIRIPYGGQKKLCKVVWVNGITAGLKFINEHS